MDKYVDNSNPCYKCESRKLYCHSKCGRYLGYKKAMEDAKSANIDEHLIYCKINYQKRR